VQNDYKQACLDVQNQQAQAMADLLNSKKTEGDELYC
jgi:hypothetical protein